MLVTGWRIYAYYFVSIDIRILLMMTTFYEVVIFILMAALVRN